MPMKVEVSEEIERPVEVVSGGTQTTTYRITHVGIAASNFGLTQSHR